MISLLIIQGVFAQSSLAKSAGPKESARVVFQEKHEGNIRVLDYSADGKYIMSADLNIALIWEAESGRLIRSIKKITSEGKNIDLAPNGAFCIYVSPGNEVEVCDIKTGHVKTIHISEFEGYADSYVEISPNSKVFAVTDDDKIYLYDAGSLQNLMEIRSDDFHSLENPVFMADFEKIGMIATSKHSLKIDDTFILLDIKTGKIAESIVTGEDSKILTFSPDGKLLACTNKYKNLVIADFRTKKVLKKLDLPYFVNDLKFTTDSKKVVICAEGENHIEVYDIQTGKRSAYIDKDVRGDVFAFSPDGKHCAVVVHTSIKIYD